MEKRRGVRRNLYIPTVIRGKNGRGIRVSERTLIINTSTGGAFFLSRHNFKPGSSLMVTAEVAAPGAPKIRFRGKVVRVDRKIYGFMNSPGFGIAVAVPPEIDLYNTYKSYC